MSTASPDAVPESEARAPLGLARTTAVCLLSAAATLLAVNFMFGLQLGGIRMIATAYHYLIIALYGAAGFLLPTGASRRFLGLDWSWTDWLLAALLLAVGFYLAANANNILMMGWDIMAPPLPTAAATALVLLALIGVWRCGGLVLLGICTVFALYPMFADHMPGVLWGAQFTPEEAMLAHALGIESIIGIPMRVVAELLIGFIVFGVALTLTGAGDFFMNLAAALMGGTRGGPAKVAILSSGFFGSLSGSVISNVLSTGTLTIPTMRRCGYPPTYAAAVEACASTGGSLMPPVMGAVAFVMAMFLNVPYSEVMVAAAVPAILFYVVLLLQADHYAARNGLAPLPVTEIPPLVPTLKQGWVHLLSLALLIYLLLAVGIERQAPWYAGGLLVITALVKSSGWRQRGDLIVKLLIESARGVGQLVLLLIGIGLVIGGLSITGVATAFSRELVHVAGDSIPLLLLAGALTSFVLGLGMTATACYIFLAIVLAPALIEVGLNAKASHLFILYWGMLSFITPPVALAAVAAANVAGASPLATGFRAVRLGLVLFILPFLFVLNPALILEAPWPEVIHAVATALVAVWLMAAAFERYLYWVGPLALWQSGVLLAGGLSLLVPEAISDLAGAAALVIVYGHHFLLRRFVAPPTPGE
jgi:TRAP transporter 4TM/12TM fusion protein